MRVKLLKDVIEGAVTNAVGEVVKEGQVKRSKRSGRPDVVFTKGAVVEMSDASAAKYIRAGMAAAAEPAAEQKKK